MNVCDVDICEIKIAKRTRPTAKKEHECNWCPEKILKGEQYVYYFLIYEGDVHTEKMHTECEKAQNEYWTEVNRQGGDESRFEIPDHKFKRGTKEPIIDDQQQT